MRVLFIQEVLPTYRVPFFRELGAFPDIDLTVLSGQADKSQGFGAPLEEELRGRVNWLRAHRTRLPIGLRRAVWFAGLADILRDCAPDVVVTQGGARMIQNQWLLWRSKRRGPPVLLFQQARNYTRESKLRSDLRLWGLRRYYLSLARGLIVYTSAERDGLVGHGFPARRVFAAENAIDSRAARDITARMPPAPTDARPSFAVVGRVITDKRVDRALAWHLALSAMVPDVELVVVGDGPDRARLQSTAGAGVSWAGAVHDDEGLSRCLRACRFVLVPGYAGLGILHAFAHRQPVLVFRSAEHKPEITYLQHGVNGLMLDEDDREGVLAAMRRLLTDVAYRERLAANAWQTAQERTVEAMAANVRAALVACCSPAEAR